MLSKNTIKYIQSLRLKKFRQKYRNFVVEGEKMALEILQSTELELEGLYALPEWLEKYKSHLVDAPSKIHSLTTKDLARISSLKTPNKVIVICKKPTYSLKVPLLNNSLTLFLDGIQDPGNMGSILRISDWFGLPYVFCSSGCVDIYNPKVVQSSMGAFLRVKSIPMEIAELKKQCPELPVLAAVLGGRNVFTTKLPKNGLLVIGNEGSGISAVVRSVANYEITIPQGQQGGAESLNAAVATGILCSALINRSEK